MFTVSGWRPGGRYEKVAPTLADAFGCLEEAEQQGFLGIKVRDETRRILTVPEMRRVLTAIESPEPKEPTPIRL